MKFNEVAVSAEMSRFLDAEGSPTKAIKRLMSKTGRTKAESGKRQPPSPDINAIIGAPTT